MTERDFTRAVLDAARLFGFRACHFSDSRKDVGGGKLVGDSDAAGFPDVVLVRGKVLVAAELKVGRGKLTPAQSEWLEVLSGVERVEVHVWRPEDWPAVERTLRRRAA